MRFKYTIAASIFLNVAFSIFSSRSEGYAAFSLVDPSFQIAKDSTMAENLPKRRSQDSLNICGAMTAGLILDATNCRTQKLNCANLPDEESFSRLDLARYAHVVPDEEKYKSFYDGISEYGSSTLIISNILHRKMSATNHKCSSLDKALTSFGDSKSLSKAQERSWQKLRETYDGYKSKREKCPTCELDLISTAQSEISQNFNITQNNNDILKAFAQDSYDKFFDRLMVPAECRKIDQAVNLFDRHTLSIKTFPEDPLKVTNYKDSLNQIKEVLNKKIPIAVNNVCLGKDFDPIKTQEKSALIQKQGFKVKSAGKTDVQNDMFACSEPHSVVISGYRKICKKDAPDDCRETIKIENSWGETWQKENNDGWVDARAFLDRTAYIGRNLLWLEDKVNTK